MQAIKRERIKEGSESLHDFNNLLNRFELGDEVTLKVQARLDKMRQQAGFKRFALKRQGVDGFLGSELNAIENFAGMIPGLKTLSKSNIATRQTAEFETAILTYLQGGLESASRINFNNKIGLTLNKPVSISDGKGGLKKTTLSKDYPVAAKVAEALKDNAFGQLTGNKFIEKMSELGSDFIGKSGLTLSLIHI